MEWPRFALKIPLEALSRFCGNLAMCLSAGMTVLGSLRTCCRSFPHPKLKSIIAEAIPRVESGMELSDALEPWRHRFPAFFLPAIRCGERSGHLEETLDYLQKHCDLLIGPTRMMRNTWLIPLSIMLFGSLFCAVAHLWMTSLTRTFHYVESEIFSYGKFLALVLVILYVPALKKLAEQLLFLLPWIGPALRELAINRFFHAMNLLYSTGGMRVEAMIRLAAESTGNAVLEEDFLRGAERIEHGGTIGEAFSSMVLLPADYKTTIVTGDEAGKLDAAFERVCRLSSDAVSSSLSAFQQIFFRLMSLLVTGSIITTLRMLFSM
jgi:type IV pilus assembly protein PilC